MQPLILTLVRHAKSSWNDANLNDFDRPLNNRGIKDAPMMAQRLAAANYKVDALISSPALRAISTAKILATEIGLNDKNFIQYEHLYEASLKVLISTVISLNNQFRNIMLVGHNPGFTALTNYLSDANIGNMPTCSIAKIQFNESAWENIYESSGELIDFDYPKKNM